MDECLKVFTTAPVNFGMTFLVLSVEHDVVRRIVSGELKVPKNIRADIAAYVTITLKKPHKNVYMKVKKRLVYLPDYMQLIE